MLASVPQAPSLSYGGALGGVAVQDRELADLDAHMLCRDD
jgi:hypothetical protein